ncbi:rhomboid family intramembrane serine protease [Pseudonocardia sp. Ae707_Ps1]|uniref:rhomboid family intramembrane serine protease n=1 Tax=Pseudonocardia sp. Ae707_Ps1 TaxID=1885572 RepID=UPI0009610BC7|nr:rhomboid family intramembrane serine protease [Pseudonocardia sp. Ae707_Ps1]OLM15749.1 rhomboid family serine protease [Pseudonocardia sp. Ae707_Ps1]
MIVPRPDRRERGSTAGSLNRNFDSPLFGLGALTPVDVADGQLWRLVTAGFLHIGPLHLAFNMFRPVGHRA